MQYQRPLSGPCCERFHFDNGNPGSSNIGWHKVVRTFYQLNGFTYIQALNDCAVIFDKGWRNSLCQIGQHAKPGGVDGLKRSMTRLSQQTSFNPSLIGRPVLHLSKPLLGSRFAPHRRLTCGSASIYTVLHENRNSFSH